MENIKTMISPIRSIWDRDDQWLHHRKLFFYCKKLKSKYVLGTVTHEQGFRSDFEFKINEFIQMMATSQASLARKANLHTMICRSILHLLLHLDNIDLIISLKRNMRRKRVLFVLKK